MKRMEQTEEHVKEIDEPVVFEGFLLDMDDEFLFLGDSPHEVCSAITRKDVNSIHILKALDIFSDVLDSMPEPTDDSDIN